MILSRIRFKLYVQKLRLLCFILTVMFNLLPMKETDFHSHIKKMVLSVCGIKFAEICHSSEISRKIFAKDKNYISEINIQRFFFFSNEPYRPSLFILNSLSMFVGAASWEDFKIKTLKTDDTNKIHCSCLKTSARELTGGMETFVYTFGKFNRYHS